jgi:L-ascorbate metabolism protein UlaG (beta-lactamase superfamily)
MKGKEMKITMLGHSTLLIEMDGKRILTDPWLVDPLYFGQLYHPGAFESRRELPHVDLVLVSHGHQDHFDPATMKMVPEKTPVLIFKGYRKAAEKMGFENVHPMGPGYVYSADGIEITGMPGKHPGGIVTYMIRGKEGSVYFGGDTVYTGELADSLKNARPDVSLMPISGGSMGLMKFHMNAKEAAVLLKASAAKLAIPTHYHFGLRVSSLNGLLFRVNCLEEFRDAMNRIAPEVPYKVLDYNESLELKKNEG